MTDLSNLAKAELNAMLAAPLRPSELKRIPRADLLAIVERTVEPVGTVIFDERNGLDDDNELIPHTVSKPRTSAALKAPATKQDKATVKKATKTVVTKAVRRVPTLTTLAPKGEVKPFRDGTVQARAAEMLSRVPGSLSIAGPMFAAAS